MKRAPIVIAGTVAGLIGVLEFHTTPAKLTTLSGTSSVAGVSSGAGQPGATPTTGGGSGAANHPGSASQQPTSSRSAVGPAVNYNFGVVSVRVTVAANKILKVGIASLNDGSNPRSQFIDEQSIPVLEQEVIQAQSANIQSVSGASYTSAGFAQSLQGALHSLGFT